MTRQAVSLEPLLRMITGFWVTKAVTVATDLELFTLVSSKGMVLSEIAKALDIKQRPAKMLLNACVALGLLRKEKGLYKNTFLAQAYLVKGKPHYIGGLIHMLGNGLYQNWGELKEITIRNRPVATEIERPRDIRGFIEAMHGLGMVQAEKLVNLIDFSGVKTLLDMGGGSGAYSLVLAKQYPHLKAVVYDFPEVCDIAQGFIRKFKLKSRVSVNPGNLLVDNVPQKFDAVILSQVLHEHSPRDCLLILRKAYQVLNRGGKLIVNESLLNDEETGPVLPALFSLNMLVHTHQGSSYSGKRIKGWLQKIGFKGINVQPSQSLLSMVIAQKPS